MTPDKVKQLMPVLQAFADGKTIQVRVGNEWYDVPGCALFSGDIKNYRVKPDEVKAWVNVYQGGGKPYIGELHDTREEAIAAQSIGSKPIARIPIYFLRGQGL
jgi:hypothetical protein